MDSVISLGGSGYYANVKVFFFYLILTFLFNW